jgi:MGT family glycosyltransferase
MSGGSPRPHPRRIALVSVGSSGHTNPVLGVATELARRGHDVVHFCGAAFADAVAATGARPSVYPTQFGAESHRTSPMQRAEGFQALQPVLLEECERALPTLMEGLRKESPDVVMYEPFSFAGRVAAETLALPLVRAFPHYALTADIARLERDQKKPSEGLLERYRVTLERVNRLAAGLGCVALEDWFTVPTPFKEEPHNIVFLPRRFQILEQTFDDRYHFVGPCIRPGDDDDPGALADLLPRGDGPLVLVSLGTVHNAWPEFFSMCLEAFADSELRVVMSVGNASTCERLGTLPDNIRAAPRLPQIALLRRSSVFVTHGGMNSTMEALSCGVPLVVVPQATDQLVTAQRVAKLRVGRRLARDEVTAERLSEVVRSLLVDAKHTSGLDALVRDIREAGGPQRAADVLEQVAARRAP